jgi:hypothetical protein
MPVLWYKPMFSKLFALRPLSALKNNHGSIYPYVNIECSDDRCPKFKKMLISEQVFGSWEYRPVSHVAMNYMI